MEGRIPIRALSVNKAFYGRKVLTEEARLYKEKFAYLLNANKPCGDIPDGDLIIIFEFGLSQYKRSDVDNCIKIALDCICSHLKIDDRIFVGIACRKVRVKNGREYISFIIKSHKFRIWNRLFKGLL